MYSQVIKVENLSFEKIRDIANQLDCYIKNENESEGELLLKRSFGLNLETIELQWDEKHSKIEISTQFSNTLDRLVAALENHDNKDSKPHRPLLPTKIRRYLVAGVVSSLLILFGVRFSWNYYLASSFYKDSYVTERAEEICDYWTYKVTDDYSRDQGGKVYRKDYYDIACETHLNTNPDDNKLRERLAGYYLSNRDYDNAEIHYKNLMDQGFYSGYDGLFNIYDTLGNEEAATNILIEEIDARRLSEHDVSDELFTLANRIATEKGIEKDFEKARQIYELSGVNSFKSKELGKLYYEGLGGPVNRIVAERLGYHPPKDMVQLYADELTENMRNSGTCATFQNQIKQTAYSQAPANVREIRINKIIDVAHRYRCLN